jgi:uncharacterized membrane protein YvbJ
MKCEGCGADLVEGAKSCAGCGREVGFGQKAAQETLHAAKETEVVAEKVGKKLWSGVKSVGSAAKKEIKGSGDKK